jgi:hypothetical protein
VASEQRRLSLRVSAATLLYPSKHDERADAQGSGASGLWRLDAGGVYRLKNEFCALAGVTHPNLCALPELWSEKVGMMTSSSVR